MSRFSENKSRKMVVTTMDSCAIPHIPGAIPPRQFLYTQTINSDKVRVTGNLYIQSTRTSVSYETLGLSDDYGTIGEINLPYLNASGALGGGIEYNTDFCATLDTVSQLFIYLPMDVPPSDEVIISIKTVYFI